MEISAHTQPSAPSGITRCANGCRENGRDKGETNRPGELPEEEQREVRALEKRDREVRAHEAAHLAAAGGHAKGGAQFTYTRGPDGQLYATGGEVSIDTSAVSGDPEATLQKAQTIQAAAQAPAQPSGQDRQVAAQAAAMATQARQEIAKGDGESQQDKGEAPATRSNPAANLLERFRAGGALNSHDSASLHLMA